METDEVVIWLFAYLYLPRLSPVPTDYIFRIFHLRFYHFVPSDGYEVIPSFFLNSDLIRSNLQYLVVHVFGQSKVDCDSLSTILHCILNSFLLDFLPNYFRNVIDVFCKHKPRRWRDVFFRWWLGREKRLLLIGAESVCDRPSSSDALAQNYGKQVGARSLYYSIKKTTTKQQKQNRMVVEFQIHNIEPNLKTIVICKDENFLHYA